MLCDPSLNPWQSQPIEPCLQARERRQTFRLTSWQESWPEAVCRHVALVDAARDIVARPQAYLSDGRVGCYMACQFRRASPTPPVTEQAGVLAIASCGPTRPRCKPTPSIFAHAPPWAGLMRRSFARYLSHVCGDDNSPDLWSRA